RTEDQCSRRAKTPETRCIEVWYGGPVTCSGLAAVSQESRSTTWSLTRRLKHSAAGRASTWDGRQNVSSRGPVCYFGCGMRSKQSGPSAVRRLSGQRHEVAEKRVPKQQARARRLQMGRLARMKPGWSAPHCDSGVILLSMMAAVWGGSLRLAETRERMGGRRGRCLAPMQASVRGPARRGADACRCSPLRVIVDEKPSIGPRRSSVSKRACEPCPQHPEHARTVTHSGRREAFHDYNTLCCRSLHDALLWSAS
ncbi:hypothetical protein CC86DRAFT_437913, partial [Ophiobolus disseminans]